MNYFILPLYPFITFIPNTVASSARVIAAYIIGSMKTRHHNANSTKNEPAITRNSPMSMMFRRGLYVNRSYVTTIDQFYPR